MTALPGAGHGSHAGGDQQQAPAAARLAGAKAWLHIQDFEIDAAFELGLLRQPLLRRCAQVAHDVDAQLLVLGIAVTQGFSARFPAAPLIAASQGAHGVEVLVVRVEREVGRLAPARDV